MPALFAAKAAWVSLPALQQCSGSIVFREFGSGDLAVKFDVSSLADRVTACCVSYLCRGFLQSIHSCLHNRQSVS